MKKKRKKDPASFQQSTCFDGEELLAYRTGGLPAEKRTRLFYHLNVEKCGRCRDLFLMLVKERDSETSTDISRKMIERLRKAGPAGRKYPSPLKLERGQIWTTSPRPKSMRGETIAALEAAFPVLIISSGNREQVLNNIIRVMPVSFDTAYQFAGETVTLDSSSPLIYPILIEIFNERPMLAGNLDEYRGLLSSGDLKTVMRVRSGFLDGNTVKPDGEYLAWKEKELELAGYLSFPVNDAVWEEGERGQTVDIPISTYRKAADTSEAGLSDISPHVLLKTSEIFLGIVQIRDRFLLRLVVEGRGEESLPGIRMDARPVSLKQKGPGIYEAVLGYADHMPETMEIETEIDGKTLVFHIRFEGRTK